MNGLCESEYEIVSIVTKTFFNQAAFSPKNAQYTHLRDKKNNTHQTIQWLMRARVCVSSSLITHWIYFWTLQMNPSNSNSANKNNDSSCSSSNTEDYNEIEDRRRRIKNRSRQVYCHFSRVFFFVYFVSWLSCFLLRYPIFFSIRYLRHISTFILINK